MSSFAEPSVAEETVTIVVADDHNVVRSGLRLLLEVEDDFTVVAEAADAESALRSVLGHKPTVLVLDLNMPGDVSSLEAIPQVGERSPGTSVVVLTMQEDRRLVPQDAAKRRLGVGGLGDDGEVVLHLEQQP